MDVSIKAKEPFWWFTKGKHVDVTLRCTDAESRAIQTYDLYRVPIIDGEPTNALEEDSSSLRIRTFDSTQYFGDFCGRKTSWHAYSDQDAREFIRGLEQGFVNFHKLLDEKLREQAGTVQSISPELNDIAKDILMRELTREPEQ